MGLHNPPNRCHKPYQLSLIRSICSWTTSSWYICRGSTCIPKTLRLTQQAHLEALTRSQSKSKLWFKYRAERITGSQVYQVTETDAHKLALSLLNSVCYPETCQFKSAATKYGCRHKKDALEAYKLQLQSGAHDQPMVTPCEFVDLHAFATWK